MRVVPNMAGFCSSLMSRCPGMLLTYLTNYFGMVSAVSLLLSHSTCAVISIVRSLYFRMLWTSSLIAFPSPESTTSINIQYIVLFVLYYQGLRCPVSCWECSVSLHFNIIIQVITFTQGIYNCIPETNHVSREYSVAAVLYLQFVLHVMLFRPWNMFCTFTLTISAVCVQCTIWLFFSVP